MAYIHLYIYICIYRTQCIMAYIPSKDKYNQQYDVSQFDPGNCQFVSGN